MLVFIMTTAGSYKKLIVMDVLSGEGYDVYSAYLYRLPILDSIFLKST